MIFKNLFSGAGINNIFKTGAEKAGSMIISIKNLNKSMKDYLGTCESGKASIAGYNAYLQSTGVAMGKVGLMTRITQGIVRGFFAVLKTVAIVVVIDLISKAVNKLIEVNKKVEKTVKTIQEINDAIKESESSLSSNTKYIKENAEAYSELAKGVDLATNANKSLSNENYEKFLEINNELAERFPTLVKGYDDNGNAIVKLKNNVNDLTASLQDLIDKQEQANNVTFNNDMSDYYEDYKDNYGEINSTRSMYSKNSQYITRSKDELEQWENLGLNYTDWGNGSGWILTPDSQKMIDQIMDEMYQDMTSKVERWFTGTHAFDQLDEASQMMAQHMIDNIDWESSDVSMIKTWEGLKSYVLNMIEKGTNALTDEDKIQIKLAFTYENENIFGYVNKIKEIQQYCDDHGIKIKFDYLIDDGEDAIKRLYTRLRQFSPEDKEQAKQYIKEKGIDTIEEIEDFLTGIADAMNFYDIQNDYEMYLKQKQSKVKVNVFSDNYDDKIDAYTDKLAKLDGYIEKIKNKTLTPDEVIDICQEMDIDPEKIDLASDSFEDLKQILQEIASTEFTNLNEFFKGLLDDDLISQDTYDQLIKIFSIMKSDAINDTTNFDSLSDGLSKLQSHYETIDKANKEYTNTQKLSLSTIQSLASTYPELETELMNYLSGISDAPTLLKSLQSAYDADLINYKNYYIEKHKYDENFYQDMVANIPENVKNRFKEYQCDLDNYTNLVEAKAKLELNLRKEIEKSHMNLNSIWMGLVEYPIGGKTLDDIYDEEYEYLMKQLTDSASLDITLPDIASTIEGQESSNEIDWIANSISNVTREIEKLNDAIGNAAEFQDKIDLYDQLDDANQKLITTTSRAAEEYGKIWDKKSGQISKKHKQDILSEKEFTIEDFDNNEAEYKKVTDAQKIYETWENAEKAYKQAIAQQTKDLNAKNQLLLDQQELLLDSNQLDIDNAKTAKDKNFLLEKEKSFKAEILRLNLLLADTEEERTKLQKEYNQYLKENANQQYENLKTERDNRISYYESRIKDIQNSLDLDEAAGGTAKQVDNNSRETKLAKGKYEIAKTAREKTYSKSNYVGNVDINNRPIVLNDDGSYSTSLTSFQERWIGDEETGSYKIIHYTPILPDGTILEGDALNNYIDSILESSDSLKADKTKNGGYGIVYKVDTEINGKPITDDNLKEAFSIADAWDIDMHNTQDKIYGHEAETLIAYKNQLANSLTAITSNKYDKKTRYEQMNDLLKQEAAVQTQNYAEALFNRDNATTNEEWEKYNQDVQSAQDSIYQCTIAQLENNKAIAALPLEQLEKENEQLEKNLAVYEKEKQSMETAISAASTVVQDEIDYQNELKESIEASYDAQVKVIQDKIDALSKVNEQEQRQLDLEEKRYNLEKAQSQRNIKVMKNGEFTYVADEEAVRNAKKEYDSAQLSAVTGELNDQKDALTKQKDNEVELIDRKIKSLSTYKDNIDSIANGWQKVYDLQVLIEKFGVDVVGKLQTGDLSVVEGLTHTYASAADAVKTTSEQIEQNKSTLETAHKFIEDWNGVESELPNILNKISQVITTNTTIDTAIEEKNRKTTSIATTWGDNNRGVRDSLDLMNQDYTETGEEESNILNTRLQNIKNFASEAKSALSDVILALSEVQNKQSAVNSLHVETTLTQGTGKNTEKVSTAGKSHTGLKLGYIGEKSTNQNKDTFKFIALSELKPDEIPRILQIGEAVTDEFQQAQILSNMRNSFISGVQHGITTPVLKNNSAVQKTFEFTGDIILNNVQDVDTLAKSISQNFLTRLDQELYK